MPVLNFYIKYWFSRDIYHCFIKAKVCLMGLLICWIPSVEFNSVILDFSYTTAQCIIKPRTDISFQISMFSVSAYEYVSIHFF